MNTRLLALIFLAVALLPAVRAQQPTPSPSEELGLRGAEPALRTDPTVSIPTENTKPNYPQPGQSLVSPKPKSESKKESSPTPALSPSPRATKAAGSSAEPAGKKNTSAILRELENKWAAATASHDITAVEALLAGDYLGVTALGNTVNKAGLLAELRKDKNSYESVVNSKLDVRIHGTTAIVVGTTKQKGKDATGKEFSFTYRWTDTWMERDGQWRCVASQSIRLSG